MCIILQPGSKSFRTYEIGWIEKWSLVSYLHRSLRYKSMGGTSACHFLQGGWANSVNGLEQPIPLVGGHAPPINPADGELLVGKWAILHHGQAGLEARKSWFLFKHTWCSLESLDRCIDSTAQRQESGDNTLPRLRSLWLACLACCCLWSPPIPRPTPGSSSI